MPANKAMLVGKPAGVPTPGTLRRPGGNPGSCPAPGPPGGKPPAAAADA